MIQQCNSINSRERLLVKKYTLANGHSAYINYFTNRLLRLNQKKNFIKKIVNQLQVTFSTNLEGLNIMQYFKNSTYVVHIYMQNN